MPKVKTRKSVIKRFKVTKNGKILRLRSFTSHLKANKSAKRRRKLRRSVTMTGFYAKKLRKFLGVTPKKWQG